MTTDPAESEMHLSPHVAALVEAVKTRVADAPTAAQIQDLADRAAESAKDNVLTISEIGELAEIAIERARKVDLLVTRLSELVSGGGDGG
jgi:hypothetical protein